MINIEQRKFYIIFRSLNSLDPKSSNSITPIYAQNLGPITTSNKILNSQYVELDKNIKSLVDSLQQISQYVNFMVLGSGEIKSYVNAQKTYISGISTEFNKFDSKIITPWVETVY